MVLDDVYSTLVFFAEQVGTRDVLNTYTPTRTPRRTAGNTKAILDLPPTPNGKITPQIENGEATLT